MYPILDVEVDTAESEYSEPEFELMLKVEVEIGDDMSEKPGER
jgi:hypothetical protein